MHKMKYSTASVLFALSTLHWQPTLAASPAHNGHNDDFTINHHEPLANLHFVEQRSSTKAKGQGTHTAAAKLSFNAYGKTFNLNLQDNSAIYGSLPEQQKRQISQNLQIYKGSLNGVKGSWARLNRSGAHLSGAIWDGKELFMIDSSDQVIKAVKNKTSAAKKPQPLIYKASDTTSKITCGIESKAKAKTGATVPALFSELKTRAKALPATLKQLDVDITADSELYRANKNDTATTKSYIVASMNVVDGIYSNQIGVHINIADNINILANNGTLTSTNQNTLLDNYLNTRPNVHGGLAHLFSGKDFGGSSSNVVGLAYIGALCNAAHGAGISQHTSNLTAMTRALIVAHEMGHNFGANHDASCPPGGYIMCPSVSGSQQFSATSLRAMNANVATATCLGTSTDGGGTTTPPTPTPPPSPAPNPTLTADIRPVTPSPVSALKRSQFKYNVAISNTGSATSTSSYVDITIPRALTFRTAVPTSSPGQCGNLNLTTRKVRCTFGNIPSGTTRSVAVNVTAPNALLQTLSTVRAGASNDSNTTNNTAYVSISIVNQLGVKN